MKYKYLEDGVLSVSVTVRELVGFVFKKGSVASFSAAAAAYSVNTGEQSRSIREREKIKNKTYHKDVRLSSQCVKDNVRLTVSGSADGVFIDETGYTVDGIITVYADKNEGEAALSLLRAQTLILAYMLSKSRAQDEVNVRLISFFAESGLEECDEQRYTHERLQEFFSAAAYELIRFIRLKSDERSEKLTACENMKFPYSSLRSGQRVLIKECYSAIKKKIMLFACAPTGIGKTLSFLYPAIKSLKSGKSSKIFYLTHSGEIKRMATRSLLFIQGERPFLRSITLSSKMKLCKYGGECVSTCKYALSHYDRANEALYALLEGNMHIDEETLLIYAERYNVCPFELGLDASMFCDVVICDYNYVFDPKISLKRYSEGVHDYLLLVDEAHNLVERTRESCSQTLDKALLISCARQLIDEKDISDTVKTVLKVFKRNEKGINEGEARIRFEINERLYLAVKSLSRSLFAISKRTVALGGTVSSEITELYFNCKGFVSACERFDKNYAVLINEDGSETVYMTNPSDHVREICKKMGTAIFFSATLLPKDYFFEMLGGGQSDIFFDVPSPFDSDNLLVMTSPLSTKYSERGRTVYELSRLVYAAVSAREGNYIVFLPSFEYMNALHGVFSESYPHIKTMKQSANMDEHERGVFLNAFLNGKRKNLTAFAVLGGVFAEGVDLAGDALSGAIVVGVGLPPPSLQREAIKAAFDNREEDGTSFAYSLPGFNKVLQAAGRVIRTPDDVGFLLLCDERYDSAEYENNFPKNWTNIKKPKNEEAVFNTVREFWEEKKDKKAK